LNNIDSEQKAKAKRDDGWISIAMPRQNIYSRQYTTKHILASVRTFMLLNGH